MSDSERTPNLSSGHLRLADLAQELEIKFLNAATTKEKILHKLDLEGAKTCRTLAKEAKYLYDRFLEWPSLPTVEVSREREALTKLLQELAERAERITK